MSLPVTHVIITIILVDLFRDYFMKSHKKYITMHTLMIAGIGSVLPDIDMPFTWLLGVLGLPPVELLKHGGITHTILFGLIFLIPAIILWKKKNHKSATYFFVITFGVFTHLLLDWFLGGGSYAGLMLFWPMSAATFKLFIFSNVNMDLAASLDAIILLGWLWHEEVKHKIKDFI